jgi:guanine deaminase
VIKLPLVLFNRDMLVVGSNVAGSNGIQTSEQPCRRTFYRGVICHALSETELAFFPDGLMVVDPHGNIEAMGEAATLTQILPLGPDDKIIHYPAPKVMIPGLIDLHVHLPQLSATGFQAPSLLEWLETRIFPAEGQFKDADRARRLANWFFQELLKNGTTTAAVFLTSHPEATQIAFETALSLGNRVVMGQNLMDMDGPVGLVRPTTQILDETQVLKDTWHKHSSGRIHYAWMPRFALSCTETLMRELGGLRQADPSVYCHTHLSEQTGEIEAVLSRFSWAKDYTQVYEDLGLLGPNTLMAHAIHLSDGECQRLKDSQTSLVHCPGSNFFLKSGRYPIEQIAQFGLNWGLGSDVGAGPELSLFNAMKEAQFMQWDWTYPVEALFYRATLGGAEALNQVERIGNFAVGKAADFIVLDPHAKSGIPEWRQEMKTLDHVKALISQLIYLGDDRLVTETVIQGRRCYRRLQPPETQMMTVGSALG